MSFPDYIARLEAASKIAERTLPEYRKMRDWKNIINGQIRYRIKTGKITADVKDQIRFVEIADYAKQKYPGLFDDWPTAEGVMKVTGGSFSTALDATIRYLPNNIEECHQEILSLSAELHKQERLIHELHSENERLRPAAERYRKICEKHKKR